MKMNASLSLIRSLAMAGFAMACANIAAAQGVQLSGAPCATPPVLHCPDADCPSDRVINQGPVVEMKTRRTYFLDYPCDRKPDETVTFILSLHGAGSYGNWQRHYFPILDYKDKYRLVIATPNSPTRAWSAPDDEYLQNIVNSVVDQIGTQNIKAFWLVGHSQGGMTSNRIVRTEFFRDRVDGWLSLSGGRLGANPGRANFGAVGGGAPEAGRGGAPPLHCASCRRRIFRSSTRRASARWTTKACRRRQRGRRSSAAGRGARRKQSSIRRRDTSTIDRGRIRRIRRGGFCHGPARHRFTCTQAAKMAALSPMSSGWRKGTPKAWSRTSPRRWSS
jgi:pimeloyl-ACP methyl ester carboxylesterase